MMTMSFALGGAHSGWEYLWGIQRILTVATL